MNNSKPMALHEPLQEASAESPVATLVHQTVVPDDYVSLDLSPKNKENKVELKPIRSEWAYGLFDCFNDSSLCTKAVFCPCLPLARISQRVGMPLSFRTSLCISCLVYIGLILLIVAGYPYIGYYGDWKDLNQKIDEYFSYKIISMLLVSLILVYCFFLRLRIRRRHRISGSCFEDCFATVFCNCCSIAQMDSQVKTQPKRYSTAGIVLPQQNNAHEYSFA